ncbi:MAG: FAD-dependent thymidylate synthase [Candidatus Aminicenantaceae bacterium]
MKVLLAGYNVDNDVIEELKKNSPEREDITPETLSASYARISRDPRPVDELRANARAEVESARRSNRAIIFKMGHHSVAEHAVFNFDILGVSRLAIEEIEKFRLCSYTEKSQRYIKLKDDFVIPEEIKNTGTEEIFVKTVKEQNELYHRLYNKLKPYIYKKYDAMAKDKKNHSILNGWAKEDARYIVSLATEGQLGMTINARNLELMIRRFASKKLSEIRSFCEKIYTLSKEVAPSIILFTEVNNFDSKTYEELKYKAGLILEEKSVDNDAVTLVDYTPDADERLIASLLHTSTSNPYHDCFKKAKSMNSRDKKELIKYTFKYMEFYDSVIREFEYVHLVFDLVVSATCFAQLKRHRMATLTAQKYNPELGITLPDSVEEVGMGSEFLRTVEQTDKAYYAIKKKTELGADYVLTNSHRKRVLLKMNARELYHFSRLREDLTAQWDIRSIAIKIGEKAKKVMPLTCLLLGGKESYPELYREIFGKKPKFFPP